MYSMHYSFCGGELVQFSFFNKIIGVGSIREGVQPLKCKCHIDFKNIYDMKKCPKPKRVEGPVYCVYVRWLLLTLPPRCDKAQETHRRDESAGGTPLLTTTSVSTSLRLSLPARLHRTLDQPSSAFMSLQQAVRATQREIYSGLQKRGTAKEGNSVKCILQVLLIKWTSGSPWRPAA